VNRTIELLQKSLRRSPNDWETRSHLAEILAENGRHQDAVDVILEVHDVPLDDAQFNLASGILVGQYPDAAKHFAQKAIDGNMSRACAHLAMARAATQLGDGAKATQHYELGTQLDSALSDENLAAVIAALAGGTAAAGAGAAGAGAAGTTPEAVEPTASDAPVVPVQLQDPTELGSAAAPVPHEEIATPAAEVADVAEGAPSAEVAPSAGVVAPGVAAPAAAAAAAENVPAPAPPAAVAEAEAGSVAGSEGEYVEGEYVEYVGLPQLAERDDTKEKLSGIGVAILANAAIITLICLIPLVAPKVLPPEITAITAPAATEDVVSKEQVVQNSPPSAPSPAQNVTKLIASSNASPVSVPMVDFDTPDAPLSLSNNMANSLSFGNGSAMGQGIPMAMKSRCTKAERAKLLTEHGGNNKVEPAVLKSLAWLKTQQREDGSWDSTGQGAGHRGAMTGLALLAYLGHCETPDSAKYGDDVLNGIMYLVELAQKNDGAMASNMDKHYPYEHGIACYAMGETYALAKYGNKPLPGVREAFERGVEIIIDGQNGDGGWVYSYTGEGNSDISVTGWQYQALKAAKHTGLKINRLDSALRGVKGLLETEQGNNGGWPYRATSGENKWTLTGAGVLGLQLLGSSRDKVMEDGLEYIFNGGPNDKTWVSADSNLRGNPNLYAWYYNTQACFQAGGDYWSKWNDVYRDKILAMQRKDGSWNGSVYDTTLATLMLEVYYRYLPATGGAN